MVHLDPGSQGFAESRCTGRDEHEFLDVDRIGGMSSPVQHVEERNRQHSGCRPAEIPEQRDIQRRGSSPGGGQRHGKDGVGTQPTLVGRAVQIEHDLVERFLIGDVPADHRRRDLIQNVGYGPRNALAAVAVSTISKLNSFERPRRCSRRHRCSAEGAASEKHLGLDGRVSPGVEDFTGPDHVDGGHGPSLGGNVSHVHSCSRGYLSVRLWLLSTIRPIRPCSRGRVSPTIPFSGTFGRTDRRLAARPPLDRCEDGVQG